MISYIRNHFHPLWRLRQRSWFRRLQAKIDFPVFKRIGKIETALFWLRDLSYLVSSDDIEQTTGRYFERIITGFKPTFFLDVGANIGIYSWRAINLTHQIEIWMFEPDEKNAQLLSKTISRNGLSQVVLHEAAVSDISGTIPFLVDGVSGTTGSLGNDSSNTSSLHPAYGMRETRDVSCVTLDSFADKLSGQKVLIKIDVEGAEDRVLRGARRLLNEIRPLILVECFDLQKIAWLSEVNYLIQDLKEADNYLAYPRELEGIVIGEWKSD